MISVFPLISTVALSEVKSPSRVQFFATPWTVGHQAPVSMGFPRQEYWNGLSFPSLEDLPDPGIKPGSPALQADYLTSLSSHLPVIVVYWFTPTSFMVLSPFLKLVIIVIPTFSPFL